jgi:3D (Asp-Asp-Asp) domain-containing protein
VEPAIEELSLQVRASAYNSTASQTDASPTLAAWGDELCSEVQSIAVSRDLIAMGLTRGTRVRIDGLPGEYKVLDRMPDRWTRKIDLYMGNDVAAARRWGVRNVTIRWSPTVQASAR